MIFRLDFYRALVGALILGMAVASVVLTIAGATAAEGWLADRISHSLLGPAPEAPQN